MTRTSPWYQRVWEEVNEAARLGRHVEHDPRSAAHAYEAVVSATEPLRDADWPRRSPILYQGNLGSCTGNAEAGWIATDNDHRAGSADVDETLAVSLYERATELDPWPGAYPPDDTGSSGNAVAKAAREAGECAGWRWAFSLTGLLRGLNHGGVLIGIPWLYSMDDPAPDGLLTVDFSSGVRGGHELLLRQSDRKGKAVGGDNSWGSSWGYQGSFRLRDADLAALLAHQGDCTIPYS
jgi:hypothetical protein